MNRCAKEKGWPRTEEQEGPARLGGGKNGMELVLQMGEELELAWEGLGS